MSDAPRVSVVVPVFNTPRDQLLQAVRSVAGQTFRDHELVIVDDGSTDPVTRAVLNELGGRAGVHVHRTENRGPAAARNLGIEHARGQYILPLDGDDYLAPAFLEKTVPVLDTEPEIGIVHTWVGLFGRHHGVWETGGVTVPELLVRCTIHVSSLYRRRLWEEVGGYDARFRETCEDWDFWLSAARRGWRARAVPEVLAYYRRSPGSREWNARDPETSARVMGYLVTKHRDLYEQHLVETMGAMYARLGAAGLMLERLYHHPVVRFGGWLRRLVGRRPAA